MYYPIDLKFVNENYVNWLNDNEVNKFLEVNKNSTLEDVKNYVLQTIKTKVYFWAIILKESNKHIGNIKIDPINEKHAYGEYGIMMGDKKEWGKGFAKEASETILKFCFEQLKLRKVNLGVIEANTPALEL
ncbi:MAG: GNAT family N-acetyltransferase, partial [Ferruginibacter sp.]|nr:GNAT family N-acetyltransferase [Ferruginibacter sp.]